MACCCCQGPGICCNGNVCTSVNACECAASGGTFLKGATLSCSQGQVITCTGQAARPAGICEACPSGCTCSPCACHMPESVNVSIAFSNISTDNLPRYGCDWQEILGTLDGDFTLNAQATPPFGWECGFTYFYYYSDGSYLSLTPGGCFAEIFQCALRWGAAWAAPWAAGVPRTSLCIGQSLPTTTLSGVVGTELNQNIAVATVTITVN